MEWIDTNRGGSQQFNLVRVLILEQFCLRKQQPCYAIIADSSVHAIHSVAYRAAVAVWRMLVQKLFFQLIQLFE